MEKLNRQTGSSSITVLIIIIIISTIFLGVSFYIQDMLVSERRLKQEIELKGLCRQKAENIREMLIEKLKDSEKADLDAPQDKTFQDINSMENVFLRDISSYININTIDVDSGIMGYLNEFMIEPDKLFIDTIDEVLPKFEQYRHDFGPFNDIKNTFRDFLNPEIIDQFFTEYGYFNFNITDQHVLRIIFKKRLNLMDSDADEFLRKYNMYLQDAILKSQNPGASNTSTIVNTRADLLRWLSANGYGQHEFDIIFPIINTESQMNINFVSETILRGFFSNPNYKNQLGDIDNKIDTIKQVRENDSNGLTMNWFRNIMSAGNNLPYPSSRLFYYFGTITWFWELKIRERNYELTWIIAREPPPENNKNSGYRVIKEEFKKIEDIE